MMSRNVWQSVVLALCIGTGWGVASAAKLVDVRVVDDEHLQVHILDSETEWKDTGTGKNAFHGGCDSAGEVIHKFNPPLDTAEAAKGENYEITSASDKNYATAAHPTKAFRKSKVNGTDRGWPDCNCSIEHFIYLELPSKMQQGAKYTLKIADGVNSDTASKDVTFDIYSSVSEAVHVNIIGYNPDVTAMKSGDLYMWMGDGGARDYAGYEGKKVSLYNVATKAKTEVGKVSFWKKSGVDFQRWNLTNSDVWNCDFSSFTGTGTFRLAVEGVGCSPEFVISKSVYYEPFKTSVRGFYYMRIGEDKEWAMSQHLAVPRQPQFMPDKDPAGFKVVMTTYGPFHPRWGKAFGADNWDHGDWSQFAEPGNPTNPNAWGGHSDATDWDRNPGHVSIIWDMLLPYILSNGKIGDDNCQIRESGNGVPDLIDEANYETDFWLRCRDGKGGYASGINNPSNNDKLMYQAGAAPWMAWCSAANAAMTAEACRIARKPELVKKYTAAAVAAWQTANEEGLEEHSGIGNGAMRGQDLKFMAAAYLYNVTGDKKYEEAMAKTCYINSPTTEIDNGKGNQLWGAVAYLVCAKNKVQPIHYQKLVDDMKAAIINEAMKKNVAEANKRPSRRSCNGAYGWFQSTQEVQTVCVAHAFATDAGDRDALLKAMVLEADWGLGRNPMNMVQMTGLGSRCPEQIFTCGRNDGVPGVQPGHTPYMNSENWGQGYMADPQFYARKGYPEWKQWPQGEALWPAPYCYSNNEFTPQQSMRGKMCLLGYLYSLGETKK